MCAGFADDSHAPHGDCSVMSSSSVKRNTTNAEMHAEADPARKVLFQQLNTEWGANEIQ